MFASSALHPHLT
jgi:glyoxylase-like metal-dependent hydrolase (beta-lactamase superfamily II)